jgi:hypothetical protein
MGCIACEQSTNADVHLLSSMGEYNFMTEFVCSTADVEDNSETGRVHTKA